MATLEKIRNQKKLLFAVIFGALLLFIVSIIDNPGSLFKDTTTVAKVDGKKISIEDLNNLSQDLQAESQQPGVDYQYVALQRLVAAALLNQEYEKLGITVTDDEMTQVLMGENSMNIIMANNALRSIVSNFVNTYGVTPQAMREAIENPEANGLGAEQVAMFKNIFSKFESDIEEQLLYTKLMRMLEGGINANKLDAKAQYDEAATTYVLAAVSRPTNMGDPASEEDVKNYYDAHREYFKIDEPKRYLRYVYTPIQATRSDRSAAVSTVMALAEACNNGTTDFNEAIANGNYALKHHVGAGDYVAQSNERGLRAFLDEAQEGEVRVLDTNAAYYGAEPQVTVAQLVGKEVKVNGGQILQVVLDGSVAPDTVVAKLNAGANPEGMAGVASVIPSTHITNQGLPTEIVDSLQTLGLGKYMAVGTADGSQRAIAFESYTDPEEVYDYYTATLKIMPSQETRDKLNADMHEFLAAASTAEYFNEENAAANNLALHYALVGQSSYQIGDNYSQNMTPLMFISNDEHAALADTKEVVAWAVDAKPGSVSRLFTAPDGSRILAAAVVEEYEDYVPVSYPGVSEAFAMPAQEDRNAKAAMAEVEGKGQTLDDYAKLFNAQRVDTIRGVNLSNPRYAGLGGLRGHKPGEVVGPMHWMGVTVAKVLEANESPMPFNEESSSYAFHNAMLNIMYQMGVLDMIRGSKPVEYNYLRFSNRQ